MMLWPHPHPLPPAPICWAMQFCRTLEPNSSHPCPHHLSSSSRPNTAQLSARTCSVDEETEPGAKCQTMAVAAALIHRSARAS